MIDASKNSQPVDLSYLSDMAGDSPEFMIEMIDLFKSQTPVYIAELEQAVKENDWAKVSMHAHRVKPTFIYVGRDDAKNHMQMMENNAKNGEDLDKMPHALDEIKSMLEVLYQQLAVARRALEQRVGS
ncbi:histidine phosphotransferase [Pedobacter yulinensis]|uniref:Histidine phosphotransferase n=1 Tax=Pedobacter yulinensis TaxID=2126353 RepID=A0A2T3HMA7_9SPHI|nr:Hpt domain-containing protein [Pedobacter yulinensis]PST83501.1 histidine phosphotransferase [Pedobacter yulinensis]